METKSGAKSNPTQEDEIALLQKLVKQRKESATIFNSQGRVDLAEKEIAQERIISEFPEDFGEHSKIAGNKVITINRSERYEWNQDLLAKIYREEEIPTHIKRRLTVDKRVFQRLTTDEQAPLVPALTRKPGPVSIKVTRSD